MKSLVLDYDFKLRFFFSFWSGLVSSPYFAYILFIVSMKQGGRDRRALKRIRSEQVNGFRQLVQS